MITERGTVLETRNDLATLLVKRGDACGSCGAGCHCGTHDEKTMRVEAKNAIKAQTGDVVEIAMETDKLIGLSMLTYIVPIVFLFIGGLAGAPLARAFSMNISADLASALFGIAALVVSFLGVGLYTRRIKPGGVMSPVILRVVPPEERTGDVAEYGFIPPPKID